MLTTKGFQVWIDRYAKASLPRDAEEIALLFNPDALYYESPFNPPHHGQLATIPCWQEIANNLDEIEFSYQILAVFNHAGIARWHSQKKRLPSGEMLVLDGIFVVEMDLFGRCRLFREWRHVQSADNIDSRLSRYLLDK